MSSRLIVVLVLVAGIAALTGCNTVEGVGKDVKATGSAIEKAAKK